VVVATHKAKSATRVITLHSFMDRSGVVNINVSLGLKKGVKLMFQGLT
jgi:hypothetical protein